MLFGRDHKSKPDSNRYFIDVDCDESRHDRYPQKCFIFYTRAVIRIMQPPSSPRRCYSCGFCRVYRAERLHSSCLERVGNIGCCHVRHKAGYMILARKLLGTLPFSLRIFRLVPITLPTFKGSADSPRVLCRDSGAVFLREALTVRQSPIQPVSPWASARLTSLPRKSAPVAAAAGSWVLIL